MAFYKGNGIRSLHILMFHRLNSDLRFWSEGAFPEFTKQIKAIPCAQEFLLTTAIDMALQPLFVAETRFIMQNRKRNFRSYQNYRQFFTSSYREIFRGCLVNIPRNFFIALTGLKVKDEIDLTTYYLTTLVFQTLSYPFLTVQKRLEARSTNTGFLSNEIYKKGRFLNCMKTMIAEEGAKSLFRGYGAFTVAILFWMSVMPLATDFLMEKLPIFIDPSKMPK